MTLDNMSLQNCWANVILAFICKEKITGGYRKLHSEELHIMFSSNILRVISSKKVRQVVG
jgi:hypothetical protein